MKKVSNIFLGTSTAMIRVEILSESVSEYFYCFAVRMF